VINLPVCAEECYNGSLARLHDGLTVALKMLIDPSLDATHT
jgi:hypothetical protein